LEILGTKCALEYQLFYSAGTVIAKDSFLLYESWFL